ncbi:DUF2306 domain-containing protein [Microbacterium sp. LTA6]|uniref:DUF2306 domain-containing protein n=1 Tax=Microbacterium sp. LTA6 TaxID=3129771 RepID=UPI003249089E
MTTKTTQDAAVQPGPVSAPGAARRRISWAFVALASIAVAAFLVSQYASGDLTSQAEDGVGLAPHYLTLPPVLQAAFYLHIGLGGVALALGPLQFSQRFRNRFRRAHRMIGRIYLVSVALGGTAALVLSPTNQAGLVGFFGFGSLAVLWLFTAWRAYRAIRTGDVRSHQAWMIRNFALTFAAVTLRLWMGVFITGQLSFGDDIDFGVAFDNAYVTVPFLCWLPNIIVAELLVRRRGLPAFRITG